MEIVAAEVFLVMQLLQREQGSARVQPRLGAAVDALQTLHQKLDVANAAAVQLDVDGRSPAAGRP